MGGLTPVELSRTLALMLPVIAFFVPFLLVFILDGFKGIRETLPALLVLSGSYTAVQTLTMISLGPELADILAALISMGALALFLKKWQPRHIYRETGNEHVPAEKYRAADIMNAWSPFYILTAVIAVWSLPGFKGLFQEGGFLKQTTILFNMPFLHREVLKTPPISPEQAPLDAVMKLDFISATGTAILIAVIITIVMSRNISFRGGLSSLKETVKELWLPVLTICFVMGFANLANYAGLSSTIGLALAKAGISFRSSVPYWAGSVSLSQVQSSATTHYSATCKQSPERKSGQVRLCCLPQIPREA